LQVGRIEAKEVRVSGCLDNQRIFEIDHFTNPLASSGPAAFRIACRSQ
jgi:hypothetical protein